VEFLQIKRMLIEHNSNLIESNEMTPSSLEGQDFKSQREKEEKLLNFGTILNCYLEANNVWTVERIV